MSGERPCVRQSDIFRSQMSGSAIGGMLDWDAATSGKTRKHRKVNKSIENTGLVYKREAPPQNNVNHSAWRAGEKGHIGDTYAKGSISPTKYKHGKHVQHHTRGPINHSAWRAGEKGHVVDAIGGRKVVSHDVPINQTWRTGEKGHIGSAYNIGSLKGKPVSRPQQQQRSPQQRSQPRPQQKIVGRGPPTSPVQIKAAATKDSTSTGSPIGKVWEDSDYWEKRRRAREQREGKQQRPTTHPRTKAQSGKRATPSMPVLNVDKARKHQSSPKYPSIRLGSKRESVDDEWDSELTKVIKLHSKDEQLRTTGQLRLKRKPKPQAKARAQTKAKPPSKGRPKWGRSTKLRATAQRMFGREEQRVLRRKQDKEQTKRRYRSVNANYGGNKVQLF